MSRERSTCSKMTTHTKHRSNLCLRQLESLIDSESGCFASDKPHFLFRDDGAVDITREVRLKFVKFAPKGTLSAQRYERI